MEYRFRTPVGKAPWVSGRATTLHSDSGEAIGYLGTITDSTERVQAEKRLQQQLARTDLLNQTTRAIADRQDLNSIFRVVLQRLENDLPTDCAGVFLLDPSNDTLIVAACSPKSQRLAAALAMSEGTTIPMEQTGLRACMQGNLVSVADTIAGGCANFAKVSKAWPAFTGSGSADGGGRYL